MEYLNILVSILLVMCLGWYLITNLQWYNYKLFRVISKHHKKNWHVVYFVTPAILFYIVPAIYFPMYFIIYLVSLYLWNRNLDRTLVLTSRVKRFFLVLLIVLFIFIIFTLDNYPLMKNLILFTLLIAYFVSGVVEKIFFNIYKNRAKQRVSSIPGLRKIAITASYGKTSIKNYLFHVLKYKYKTYKTPRSVNTIAGIVLDVNKELPLDTQIYIAEAGARAKGDIKEIANFLEPEICIIGSVGEQHIEYFKTLENIFETKMELLSSPNMVKAFVHESVPISESKKIIKFPKGLKVVKSNLDGIWFDVLVENKNEHFFAPVLGSFNAINLTSVVLASYSLGMSIDEIKIALKQMPQVEHRLQKIEANGKLIIDDSFNGNLEGMLEAINICSEFEGRKVIVTPGIVESTDEANILLAKKINKYFDYVILTGSLNIQLLSANIDSKKVYVLKEKSQMQNILAKTTRTGDLILFANDAPNFI